MQLKFLRRFEARRAGLTSKERGATVVLVALSMLAMLGMAAVSVDYAVASSEKRSLQNAADAAALAVAKDCSVESVNCNAATAQWYARQNSGASTDVQTLKDGTPKSPAYADGKVTVRVRKNVEHSFAGVIGDDSTDLTAEATASWNTVPLVGANLIPIGLPYCDWVNNKPASETSPGPMRTYLWARHQSTEYSCPGTGATKATVYGRRGSASGYTNFGRAMWFTASSWPGVNSNCNYRASLWDVYADVLEDWALFGWDSCMTGKLSGIGPGSVIMFPIYAIEKSSIFWNTVTYNSRLVIMGFAPFKVDKWVTYPAGFLGQQPSSGSLGTSNSCSFGFWVGLPYLFTLTLGGTCAGIRGQFIRSRQGALFNNFTEFGTSYNNPTSGLGGNAPNLGLSSVTLTN